MTSTKTVSPPATISSAGPTPSQPPSNSSTPAITNHRLSTTSTTNQTAQPPTSQVASSTPNTSPLRSHTHTPHASISSSQRLLNPPSLIEYKNMKFLVMDAPSDGNLPLYMKEMDKHGVTDVVRACDPTYSKEPLEKRGIKVHELNFKDGDPPPNHVINEWLSLVYNKFKANQSTISTSHNSVASNPNSSPNTRAQTPSHSHSNSITSGVQEEGVSAIAVHCVAGLGRAPILVAIALIEFTSMPPLETIEFIRKKRRGAFNSRQIQFIDSYKKRGVGSGSGKGFLGKKSGKSSSGEEREKKEKDKEKEKEKEKDKDSKCTVM